MEKLWVDKYRPTTLDELDFNQGQAELLKQLVSKSDLPHILLYGPSGAGKKTRALALLAEIFGKGVYKLKSETREFKVGTGSATVDCVVISSNYHIEVNPSDAESRDRIIVQKLIKEIASNQLLEKKGKTNFKVVIIHEVDQLTKEAQASLRRTMEKYMSACRLIFLSENLSKIISPLRSRCLMIRCPAPKPAEVISVLTRVAEKEGFSLPESTANSLVEASERNLRRALLLLQTARMQHRDMGTADLKLQVPEWEQLCKEICRKAMTTQSPQMLKVLRGSVYELLTNCIPPSLIFRKLVENFCQEAADCEEKYEIVYWGAYHESYMHTGTKPIMHIEAFLARIMSVHKNHMIMLDQMMMDGM